MTTLKYGDIVAIYDHRSKRWMSYLASPSFTCDNVQMFKKVKFSGPAAQTPQTKIPNQDIMFFKLRPRSKQVGEEVLYDDSVIITQTGPWQLGSLMNAPGKCNGVVFTRSMEPRNVFDPSFWELHLSTKGGYQQPMQAEVVSAADVGLTPPSGANLFHLAEDGETRDPAYIGMVHHFLGLHRYERTDKRGQFEFVIISDQTKTPAAGAALDCPECPACETTSTTAKWLPWILLVVVVIGGLIWYNNHKCVKKTRK